MLYDHCEGLHWTLIELGAKDPEDQLQDWIDEVGFVAVADVVQPWTPLLRLMELWTDHWSNKGNLNLLKLMAFEHALGRHVSALDQVASIPSRILYRNLFLNLGRCLHKVGREATWERPFVMGRTLQMSQFYLRLAADSIVDERHHLQEIHGRLGSITALMSRHIEVSIQELREASENLRKSFDLGNTSAEAVAHTTELHLALFDATGDPEDLEAVVAFGRVITNVQVTLNRAEGHLRLAGLLGPGEDQKAHLSASHDLLASIQTSDPEVDGPAYVRYRILRTLTYHGRKGHASGLLRVLRNSKLPFGLANSIELADRTDAHVQALISSVIEDLDSWERNGASAGRRVLAYALRAQSRALGTSSPEGLAYLQRSIGAQFRDGGELNSHIDDGSMHHLANDMLLFAALTNDRQLRTGGYLLLLGRQPPHRASATTFAIIGSDLEANGGFDPTQSLPDEWAVHVRAGDYPTFYKQAASLALRSSDLKKTLLGSRRSVQIVDDHLNLASGKLVFKRSHPENIRRECARVRLLEAELRGAPWNEAFEVPELLSVSDVSFSGQIIGEQSVPTSLALFRFKVGETLDQRARAGVELPVTLVRSCALYLAFLHTRQWFGSDRKKSVRGQTREESIPWFRNFFGEAADDEFNRWWQLVTDLPSTPRRDAHPGNWLITDENKISAVDLESAGMRPIGWEVAQLCDDVPIFSTTHSAWMERLRVLEEYRLGLVRGGLAVDAAHLLQGFSASVLARSIRALTNPELDHQQAQHATALLRLLTEVGDSDVRSIAESWLERITTRAAVIAPGRAVALSKTLAFITRHDKSIPRTAAGWSKIDDVIRRAGELRRPMSPSELRTVATRGVERRFEVRGSEIRARYGHSARAVHHETEGPVPLRLYHATLVRNFDTIFKDRQGLRPMRRSQTHLSSDLSSAFAAGRRHGSPVILCSEDFSNVVRASTLTWVSDHLRAESLRVVPTSALLQLEAIKLRV